MNATATCPVCGTHKCKCPRPTPADVARAVATGKRTLAAALAAEARGHRLTTAVIGGRLVAVERFDD